MNIIKNKLLISAVIPITDETYSLKKTVDILISENKKYIKEIIIVASAVITKKASLYTAIQLKLKYKNIKIIFQKNPYFGGAMIDGFKFSTGTHVLIIASDLETHPKEVKKMIKILLKNKNVIIGASRWLKSGGFYGYNKTKLILNFFFQLFFKILFFSNLTDFTYGFRIFPIEIIKKYKWKELKHPISLEMILRPLKDGYKSEEIAVKWKPRSEGRSKNPFFENFKYFNVGLKIKLGFY